MLQEESNMAMASEAIHGVVEMPIFTMVQELMLAWMIGWGACGGLRSMVCLT
jgi:hypothetical protein